MAPRKVPVLQPGKNNHPPPECFNTNLILVTVGPEKEAFRIHRGLLCHYSDYFQAALNSPFQESLTGEIDLKTDEVEIFKLFNTWLYTGKVHLALDGATKDREWYRLSRLYVFADMRLVPRLKDTVVSMIVAKDSDFQDVSMEKIAYVYEHTPASSCLRKLLADMFACKAKVDQLSREELKESLGDQFGDFCWDLALSLHEMRPKHASQSGTVRFDRDICKYHEHGKGEVCAAGGPFS